MPRFKDLKQVKLSTVRYGTPFWAAETSDPKRMADLMQCYHCHTHDNCMTHYDKQTASTYHYNAHLNKTVYIPK